mmetsp:Transcript_19427/g.32045  ORF Transcript_19427/g.32045 Transcript_19427/m.32045 type:complete len:462 (-) Transcript_19427:910-2295(-)
MSEKQLEELRNRILQRQNSRGAGEGSLSRRSHDRNDRSSRDPETKNKADRERNGDGAGGASSKTAAAFPPRSVVRKHRQQPSGRRNISIKRKDPPSRSTRDHREHGTHNETRKRSRSKERERGSSAPSSTRDDKKRAVGGIGGADHVKEEIRQQIEKIKQRAQAAARQSSLEDGEIGEGGKGTAGSASKVGGKKDDEEDSDHSAYGVADEEPSSRKGEVSTSNTSQQQQQHLNDNDDFVPSPILNNQPQPGACNTVEAKKKKNGDKDMVVDDVKATTDGTKDAASNTAAAAAALMDTRPSEDQIQNQNDEITPLKKKKKAKRLHVPAFMGSRSVQFYKRLNTIEEGTYGVVHRAHDKDTGKVVALKKIKMDKASGSFPITSLREINILMAIDHPNIVKLKEIVIGEDLKSIYMVMEYLDHDMKMLLGGQMKQPFRQSEVKTLMMQFLSAVDALHKGWIIHR